MDIARYSSRIAFYERTVKQLSRFAVSRWIMANVLTRLDMRLKGTRFAPSTFGVDLPLCFLTTTGAKSGELRTAPLIFVTINEASIAVVASNFGTEHHPGWSYNLEAHPRASVEIDDTRKVVVARRATKEEQADVWPRFDGVWPGYEEYRSVAPRTIKMFFLETVA